MSTGRYRLSGSFHSFDGVEMGVERPVKFQTNFYGRFLSFSVQTLICMPPPPLLLYKHSHRKQFSIFTSINVITKGQKHFYG